MQSHVLAWLCAFRHPNCPKPTPYSCLLMPAAACCCCWRCCVCQQAARPTRLGQLTLPQTSWPFGSSQDTQHPCSCCRSAPQRRLQETERRQESGGGQGARQWSSGPALWLPLKLLANPQTFPYTRLPCLPHVPTHPPTRDKVVDSSHRSGIGVGSGLGRGDV